MGQYPISQNIYEGNVYIYVISYLKCTSDKYFSKNFSSSAFTVDPFQLDSVQISCSVYSMEIIVTGTLTISFQVPSKGLYSSNYKFHNTVLFAADDANVTKVLFHNISLGTGRKD
jgi:hypothetical protein